ncbi:hypothetical protein WICPIJ_009907 [Wickerhamomyces pijperi]|uniref:Vacuolar protein sorting-associated protein 8 central domain-containing protein n=1 Tax=Wickerhamomyces pijperi TaxID=599730 RepID=A0A9P8TC61_WICPI|nr:hypothetical protein WICPIJ_009907 [Wickerhamomyces pijperi]
MPLEVQLSTITPSGVSETTTKDIPLTELESDTNENDSSNCQTPTKQIKTPQAPLNRLNDFGSPLFSSNTSSMNSSPRKRNSQSHRRRFDDRIRSHFSTISTIQAPEHSSTTPTSSKTQHSKPAPYLSEIKWADLETMNHQLWSHEMRTLHGEPTSIVPGDLVVMGTSRGHILVFDYNQRLIHTIGVDSQQSVSGAAMALTISLDLTHIAAGMANGAVFVWELNNIHRPLIHIPPLRANSISDVADGHIEGSTITNLCFVGRRRSVLMSGDVHGMVILHKVNKRVLGVTCSSKRILGHYGSLRQNKPVTILGCAALPLGSYVDITEDKGLVAIMNQNALVIVSTNANNVKTEFSTGKPQMVDTRMGNSGCLAWFPACVLKDGTRLPARLAYCFDNVLTIVEVSGSGFAGNEYRERKEDVEISLSFRSQKRLICDELIVGIQWINNTLLALITHTQSFILVNEKTMVPSTPLDLLARNIFTPDLYSNMESHQSFRASVNSTFKTYRGKLFIVGKYEILIGSLPTWIDKLLDLVVKREYVAAIERALSYYTGQDIDLDSVALPLNDDKRHELILNYLKDMINVSINQVITSDMYDDELHELLYTSIKALISVDAGSVVFEDLYELIRLRSLENVFFDSLEPFVLKGDITRLTATVLNDMILYYSTFGKTDQLERVVCSLDITVLDIDSTLATLKKNNLIDSYVFIWNTLLKDYVSPLLDLIASSDDRAYGYLAYILTGRQYPTENQISSESEATDAKLSIYHLLFNGAYITHDNITSHDDQDISSFPYLHMLLAQDSRAFLSAFNEIFEDSMLNDDDIIHLGGEKLKVNRQFIVDILVEVFTDMQVDAGNDTLNLSIFIARNYPKFKQFIRLSETLLDRTIKDLCSYTTSTDDVDVELRDDCELSLQSLLSVYQPSNKSDLMDFFEKAGFYEILINLYLNDKRYSKVLQIWLLMDSTNSIDTTAGILEKCFRSTERDQKERQRVIEVIKDNFELIIETDTTKVVTSINKYCPSLHKIALSSEQVQLKYMYLSALAQLEKSGSYKLSSMDRTELIKSMSSIDPGSLVPFLKESKDTAYNFEECVDCLKTNGCVDALIYLFNSKGDYERSIEEIIVHLERLFTALEANSSVSPVLNLEKQLWKYLQVAITICNTEITQSQYSRGQITSDLTKDETLWLRLIDFIVQKLKQVDRNKSSKLSDIVKRLLQDLFTSLINTRSKFISDKSVQRSEHYQTSFLRIFTNFINSPKANVAYLGDIRSVTTEIYLAFTYEKHVLTITSNLLNEVIYSNIQRSMSHAVKGWSVKNFECEACGKTIWGRGISSDSFISWGAKKGLHGFEEPVKEKKLLLDLISFDCGHCYHLQCLKNWDSDDSSKAVCILCHDH